MGRLSGYRYREIIKILKRFGFEFHRQAAGSHEIWHNPNTNRLLQYRIIQVICQKARSELYLNKQISIPKNSLNQNKTNHNSVFKPLLAAGLGKSTHLVAVGNALWTKKLIMKRLIICFLTAIAIHSFGQEAQGCQ
jgi:hypothetical protein